MDCGIQFIETLKKIRFSKADCLNGEDFDWLFETLEDKSFLEWFCTTLNEHHALSDAELQAYNMLLNSSKPLLELEALDEVLKTCTTLEPNTNTCEEDDEENLKILEDEFQALQKMKQLKIHRRNNLQFMASSNNLMSQKLKEKGEETPKTLKESQGIFTVMNKKINNELHYLTEQVEKLTSFFAVESRTTKQQELDLHPVLLVQLPLDKYLGQEEQSTAALTLYTKKQFFQGISELVESSNEQNFQLIDIRNTFSYEKNSDACGERLELTRLQMAYVCAQHQLIQQEAKNLSLRSGLRWAEENTDYLKRTPEREGFEARISGLNNDISKIKKHLAQINNETLPLLLKEDKELLNMPVVRGNFDLQIARQDYFMSRQDQICNQLIKQKASFELLQLAYEIELRKLKENSHILENMVQDLKQSNVTLDETLEIMSEPSVSHHKALRSTVDSNDIATHRLCQLLEGENPTQLFRTHKGLEQMAEKLHLNTMAMLDQLAITSQEQTLLLSKMDADLIALRDSMYCSGESICLSNQELAEKFSWLEFQLNKLNQLIMDFLADIKAKKKVLENNKLQQMERKLYVYFLKDMEHLKNIVERLEQQVKVQAMS